MEQAKTCRDCGGRMTKGFVADANYGTTAFSQERWFRGTALYSWYKGLQADGKKIKLADGLEVVTFRCDRCHLLQSFAS